MSTSKIDTVKVKELHRCLLTHLGRTGRAPLHEAIRDATGLDGDAVEEALIELEETGCIYRDPATREILAAYPFSTRPTDHIVRFPDGHEVYSMCAVDALGMPAMLDSDAIILSRCAQCGGPIRIAVRTNALAEYTPQDIRVSYRKAEACSVAALDQCPAINFFCSGEHLSVWRAGRSDERLIELGLIQAFEESRAFFGNLLREPGPGPG